MKRYLVLLSAFLFSFVLTLPAFADAVYPYTTPVYIPTAQAGALTYTAPADYTFSLNGVSAVSLRITGTCTSLAASLQGSNDGTNFTPINISSIGAARSSAYTIGAPGFWRADTSGFTTARVHITALTASCTVSMAGTQGAIRASTDPCQDPSIQKSSVAISQSSSTTAAVVAAATGKSIYMCAFHATAVGTNPTVTVKYGTHTSADCDTGATNLTGAMNPSATVGSIDLVIGGATVASAPASNQLCLTTAATSTVTGVLVYVQQ